MSKFNFSERLNCSGNAALSGKILSPPPTAAAAIASMTPPADEAPPEAQYAAPFSSLREVRAYGGFSDISQHTQLKELRRTYTELRGNEPLKRRAVVEATRAFTSAAEVRQTVCEQG